MEQLFPTQSLEEFSLDRQDRRLPARRVDRGEVGLTTRDNTVSEQASQSAISLDEARLIRFHAVQERVGMGRTAVYELIKLGKFPRPVKIGAASAWIDVEITHWIEELAAKRKNSR